MHVEFPTTMFPWVMTISKANSQETKTQLINRLKAVAESGCEFSDVVNSISIEILKVHKFDEFLPEALLRKRAGQEWLDWDQANQDLERITQESLD